MDKPYNKQEGSSLIEVIVAMFIIAALVVVYAAALNTSVLTRRLRYENVAYHIANKQMEELRSTAIASLPASGSFSDSLLSSIPGGAASFTVTDHTGFTGMKELTVTVTWNDGQSRSVSIMTLAGTGGLNP